tara:strand:- start:6879 stop:9326 length:2448 start_codon:yes stop_codon:yes gene_type:complete
MPRERGSFKNHYSDMSNDYGAPVGAIMSVFVGAHDDGDSTNASKVEHQYPGWLYCDGRQLNIADFPLLYDALQNKYGGTAPTLVDLRDWGDNTQLTGTFKLPDMRMKRVNGPDGIDGAGSQTPDLSTMEVGMTGGEWYISRARQLEEYGFGTVRVTGYSSVTGFVKGTLSGQAVIKIGPLQPHTLSGPPPHTHTVLGSEAGPQTYEKGLAMDDNRSPNYVTNRSPIQQWVPEDRGYAAEHSHYFCEYRPRRGIDPGAGTLAQYSYDISPTYAHEFTSGTQTDAIGQVEFTDPGTHSWTAPAGVTSICVVCVGGGAGGTGIMVGGGGGGLGYKNNIVVAPGSSYTVVVGAGGQGTDVEYPSTWPEGNDSYFISAATCKGGGGGKGGSSYTSRNGGDFVGDGGGNGGECTTYGGGGGAGGYSGDGGGGNTSGGTGPIVSGDGSGGGGGAGSHQNFPSGGCGGGGVGLKGQGANGVQGSPIDQNTEGGVMNGGQGGSGGTAGGNSTAPYQNNNNWVLMHPTNATNTYWSTFMQQYGISKGRPIPGNEHLPDPYLNQNQFGQRLVTLTGATQLWIRVQADDVADVYWDGVKKNTSPIQDGTADTNIDLGTVAAGTYRFSWNLTNTGTAGSSIDDNPGGIAWQLSSASGGLGTVFATSQDAVGSTSTYTHFNGTDGGDVGGGGGACYNTAISTDTTATAGNGGDGGVRIMWGPGRAYPATDAGDKTPQDSVDPGTSDAYSNVYGKNKVNENVNNENGQAVSFFIDKTLSVTPSAAAMTVNDGTLTMTGAEQITVSAGIVPRTPIPLVLKYFRVKYLIKAW